MQPPLPCCRRLPLREDKLVDLEAASLGSVNWRALAPNAAGDWLSQRSDTFAAFAALSSKSSAGERLVHFKLATGGIATGRDSWCWNFSNKALKENVSRMIENYDQEIQLALSDPSYKRVDDPTLLSWSQSLDRRFSKREKIRFDSSAVRTGLYRPYTRGNAYVDKALVHSTYRLASVFPTPHHRNLGIVVIQSGARTAFSAVMTDLMPDSKTYVDDALLYPRWTYERPKASSQDLLVDEAATLDTWGYGRVDNVTDQILDHYQSRFGTEVSKDDVFYYVYGLLHSEQYRTTFAADLKRTHPRVPLPSSAVTFKTFVTAGQTLSDLHVSYESADPYPLEEQSTGSLSTDNTDLYRVAKMRWRSKTDRSAIVFNGQLTLAGIPDEAHEYRLGSRTALEWLIDRYQVKTDKATGIVNDPNGWADEHGDPYYLVNLIKRVTTVSVETVKIVQSLPELDFG